MKWEFLDPDFRLFLVGHPSSHTCSPLPWSFCQAEIWCMYPVMFALCEWTLPRMALGLVLQPGHFLLQVAGESWVQVRASSERTCSTVASYMHLPQPIPVTCCFEIVVISDGCFTCANEMVGNWLETWNEWVEKRWWVELPKLAMFFNSLSECLYVRECRCACSYAWNWCFNNKTVSRMQQNVQLAGACVLSSWWKIELPVEVFLWWEVPQRTLWSGWLFLIITSMTMIFLGSILESHSSRGDVESWRFRTFPPLSPNKQGTKTFPEEIEVAGSLDFLILHLPARWLRCVLNRFR